MKTRCNSKVLQIAILLVGAQLPLLADGGNHSTEQRKIAQLEKQVSVLRESYALARSDADTARRQLREIRERLEALGGAALGESEERLIETIAQLESTREELHRVTTSAAQLAAAVDVYVSKALMEDAEAVLQLEVAQRELDLALGYRTEPTNELDGTLTRASVLSIDTESGAIIINAGREAKVQVGMPMEIKRGDNVIAIAMVTDVRKQVSALLVHKHLNKKLGIKVGDQATVQISD